MRTRNKVYRVGRLSQRPYLFRQNIPKWARQMERYAMNDETSEDVAGRPGGLSAQVMHRIGLRILAGLTLSCLVGFVVAPLMPQLVYLAVLGFIIGSLLVFLFHMARGDM